MKINEFITNYNSTDALEVKKYISINQKRMLARDALDRNVDDSNGYLALDRVGVDMSFEMNIVAAYTNLEVVDEIEDYDTLCESGWMNKIIEEIGSDYYDAQIILVKEREALFDQNSIEAQVSRVTNSLVNAIDVLSEKMNGAIGDFNMNQLLPEGTDVNELIKILNKLK